MNVEIVWLDNAGLPVDGRFQNVSLTVIPRIGEFVALEKKGEKTATYEYYEVANIIHRLLLPSEMDEPAARGSVSIYIREASDPYGKPSPFGFGFQCKRGGNHA